MKPELDRDLITRSAMQCKNIKEKIMKYRFSIFLLGIFIANTLVDILCWIKGIPIKMSYFIVLVNDVTFCLLMLVTILQERIIEKLEKILSVIDCCRVAFFNIEHGNLPCGANCDQACDNCDDKTTDNGSTCMANIARKMRIELEKI